MYTPAKLNDGSDAVYDEDEGLGYGFGWGIEHSEKYGLIVSHSGGMPGVITWFERFIDADRTLVFLCNRAPVEYRAMMGFYEGMRKIARDEEPEPVRTVEEIALGYPDRSKWESFCGKYEHPEDGDFIVDEVFLKDGDLYAKVLDDDGDEHEYRLYPIGEYEFGRKAGMVRIRFGENCLTIDDVTSRKL